MSSKSKSSDFHFDGFDNPTTTPVPDVVFDQFLAVLGEAELKALLYIIRRTFGFKKDRDPISFNQFLRGIASRDGQNFDRGCGIRNRTTLSTALKSLEDKGIIQSEKGMDEQGENVTTVYSLRFKNRNPGGEAEERHDREAQEIEKIDNLKIAINDEVEGGVVRETYQGSTRNVPGGSTRNVLPVVRETYPQQTVKQQTDVVVVDTPAILNFFGVERQKAEALVQKYPADYIRAKVELLEWKLENQGPGRRIGDPAAWLIRAIEQDYRPPAGFYRKAQRWREAQESQNAWESAEGAEKISPTTPRSRQQQVLETLRRQYRTTAEEMELWAQTLEEIRLATTKAAFQAWFAQTEVLSLRDKEAVIAVPNQATKEWLAKRLSGVVSRALYNVLGASVAINFIVYDS